MDNKHICQRGFEKISPEQFIKDFNGHLDTDYTAMATPKRATAKSAGYDIYSPIDITLKPLESIKVPTGFKAYMKDDEVLFAFPRSGYGFKYFVRLANTIGVIDADFYNNEGNEGHIFIKIRNEGNDLFQIKKGDAIGQFIFQKYLLVDGDSFDGEQRKGGFGSTNG